MEITSGVYFILNNKTKMIKIGCSNNIKKRFEGLQKEMYHLGFDDELILLGTIYNEKYYDVETYIHQQYKIQRGIGEWFNISKEDVYKCIDNFNYNNVILKEENEINNIEYSDITNDDYIIILGQPIYKDCIKNIIKAGLNITEKGVLYTIFEMSSFNNECIISMDELCENTGMTNRNIRRYLKVFRDKDIIANECYNNKMSVCINRKLLMKYKEVSI